MKSSLYLFAEKEGVDIYECQMPSPKLKGLYSDGIVILSDTIDTEAEKDCILAEELGHYSTNYGHIIDDSVVSAKQENLARGWAYEELVPISMLIQAFEENIKSRFELAEYLDITEEFIEEAVDHYLNKYGPFIELEGYLVYFSPLGVLKKFCE